MQKSTIASHAPLQNPRSPRPNSMLETLISRVEGLIANGDRARSPSSPGARRSASPPQAAWSTRDNALPAQLRSQSTRKHRPPHQLLAGIYYVRWIYIRFWGYACVLFLDTIRALSLLSCAIARCFCSPLQSFNELALLHLHCCQYSKQSRTLPAIALPSPRRPTPPSSISSVMSTPILRARCSARTSPTSFRRLVEAMRSEHL